MTKETIGEMPAFAGMTKEGRHDVIQSSFPRKKEIGASFPRKRESLLFIDAIDLLHPPLKVSLGIRPPVIRPGKGSEPVNQSLLLIV